MADAPQKAREIQGGDLSTLPSFIELTSATDQPTTLIWTPARKIVIYGNWRKPLTLGDSSDPHLKSIEEREKKQWKSFPSALRDLLRRVDAERESTGNLWLPTKVEVMLWPYEYAPDPSTPWPASWPDLKAPDTRHSDDLYSVFVPSESYPALLKLIAARKPRGAILIDGKKMAIGYRFPFPGEMAWMR